MSFRAKFIFLAAIGFLAIAGLILAVVLRPQKSPAGQTLTNLEKTSETSTLVSPPLPAAPLENQAKKLNSAELAAAQKEMAIKNQTKIFVERFGSYSPGAEFANFDELRPLLTQNVAEWLENYKKKLLASQPEGFQGVTTRVVVQKIISSDETHASVLASTQREETINGSVNVYPRDMLVKLARQNNQWLIDGAYWQ